MTTHQPLNKAASKKAAAKKTPASDKTTVSQKTGASKKQSAPKGADTDPVVEESSTTRPTPSWADRNPELRRRYIAVEAELDVAIAADDQALVAAKKREIERIAKEFVELNRGLVIQQARLFARNTADDDDNVSAAQLGLWEAFLRFDPDRGVAFSTFSRQHISGGVQRNVRRNEFQHLSQNEFNLRKQIRLAQAQLAARLGRQPGIEELAANCGLPLDKVEKVLSPSLASLNAVVGEDGFTLGDRLESTLLDAEDEGVSLETFLDALTDLELWVLLQRGGFLGSSGVSLVETADGIGIGREVARRAETRARIRLAASALADRLGRLPEKEEIAALMQVDLKHVTEYHTVSLEEMHARWRRCCDAVRFAGSEQERRIANERLDRCGEEFMELASEMIFDAAGRYMDTTSHAIGLTEATRLVWEAFTTWTPGESTFPAQMRDVLATKYRRTRTVTPQRTLPPDELWYLVRDVRVSA
jgi:DNA-directed RNA polymerase specialized sigma subunit